MLFNSFEYILLFLPVTFFVYFGLNKAKLVQLSKGWLVFASLFFYSFWNIKYLPLILCSMLFNYSIGSTLNNPTNLKLKINRKMVLAFGITCNLLLLGYYKYFDFFISNINLALNNHFNLLHIILPLGISFFTFTQIAYLVDAYKQEVKEADLLNYALFVTFFPHLIAGPILHHREMMPQFSKLKNKVINHKNISAGIFLFTIGLMKKVIIADALIPIVNQGFDVAKTLNFFEGWFTSLSYAIQLYFDFSGYTDMALGTAMMFNIFLPKNFNSPYKAFDIQDFWRRWHITLSRFLKNYIYIPLGGNRLGKFKTYRNLFVTFLIGGIWHGAAWTFVIWGTLHGFAIIINRIWQKFKIPIHPFISVASTLIFVNVCWVFFRANNFDSALKVLKGMFGFNGFALPEVFHGVLRFQYISSLDLTNKLEFCPLYIFVIAIIFLFFKNSNELTNRFRPSFQMAIINIIVLGIILFNMNRVSEFLYFNF